MFSKKIVIGIVLVVVSGLAIGIYLVRSNQNALKARRVNKKIEASSSQAIINSQTDWETGIIKVNIDSASLAGSIKIYDKTLGSTSKIDLSGSVLTASTHQDNAANAIDNDVATSWGPVNCPCSEGINYLIIEAPSSLNVKKIKIKYSLVGNPSIKEGVDVYASDDGSTWDLIHGFGSAAPEEYDLPSTIYKKYWKLVPNNKACGGGGPINQEVFNFELYPPAKAIATHISAATQINGGDNFFQWQTFTPTQTVSPPTTLVSYKFRTSPDGSSWTSWSASQTPTSGNALDITSLVTSKLGDTYYKYMQVETTLANTDGSSTPTVDSYSVGYHTNVKPNKPTAQTAVIGQ